MNVVLLCAAVCWMAEVTLARTMETVDFNEVPITEKEFHVPPLEEVVDVLSRGLADNFESVSVSVEDCPDLTKEPFNIATKGLSGDVKLIELGGPPYLVPLVQRDKVYDLVRLLKFLKRDRAYIGGAGAGPWPYCGVNCEGIINMRVDDGVVTQGTRIVTVQPVGAAKGASGFQQELLPANETRSSLLGNCLLTDGAPGKVIKVVAKNRTGPSNFITSIRETLKNYYGDKVVGLGGTFLLRSGKAKFHVMPDFSETPLTSDEDVDSWLHYFEVTAPLVHLGTLVTGDLELDLRVQHFHGFSAHGSGGHYHYDTTPAEAHYEGYFVPARTVLRVDPPAVTHQLGRD